MGKKEDILLDDVGGLRKDLVGQFEDGMRYSRRANQQGFGPQAGRNGH